MATTPPSPTHTTIAPEVSEDVRTYEVVVLLPLDGSEKELHDAQHVIEQIFEEKGAKKLHKDVWGRRGLAYRIKGKNEACFVVYLYDVQPAFLKEIDRAIALEKPVLRHLMTKIPKNHKIIHYSVKYEEWLKQREEKTQQMEREREEVLKQKIVEGAGRGLGQGARKKREQIKEGELGEKLDAIIADEHLNL